jgi:transcriptional regulator with XRE-family HTH domain
VSPDQIKALRTELNCTAQELALTLGLDLKAVQAWESGTEFPTKRTVLQLEALRTKGASSVVRKISSRNKSAVSGIDRLADPEFWRLVRKLAAHPQLFAQVNALAEPFEDPTPSTSTK